MPLVSTPSAHGLPLDGQPRVPKLSYRKPPADSTNVEPRRSTCTVATSATAETFATSFPSPPPSEAPLQSPKSPSRPSIKSPRSPSSATSTNVKKKGKMLGGLFSVKDPSMAAMHQYEEQMKKEGLFKKDISRRPLLKSAEKWDGRPETLAQQQKDAKVWATTQGGKERQEAMTRSKEKSGEQRRRQSLDSPYPPMSPSMDNFSGFTGPPSLFGFTGKSTSAPGSRSSNDKPNRRLLFSQAGSFLSDYSPTRKSQSDTVSFISDGEPQFCQMSPTYRSSTKSHSSSTLVDSVPVLDDYISDPPPIPKEYRYEKISQHAAPVSPAYLSNPVLPAVTEPSNEVAIEMSIGTPRKSPKGDMNIEDISTLKGFPCTPPPASPVRPRRDAYKLSKNVKGITVNLPMDEEVIIKSSGPNILSPPSAGKLKAKGAGFPASETRKFQLSEGETSPRSILKTSHTSNRRSALASHTHKADDEQRPISRKTPKLSKFKSALGTAIEGDVFDWKATPESTKDCRDLEKDNHPSSPGSKSLFKQGRLNIFGKEKDDR